MNEFHDEEPFKRIQRQVNAQDALNITAPSKPRQIGEDSDEFADPSGDIPEELGGDASDKKLPFDFVFMFTGSEADIANIPPEYGVFALMNGSSNSVGNGGSGINLSGRFIVCIGQASGSDSGGTESGRANYSVGNTGGYQQHGNNGTINVNNHTNHDLDHYHLYSPDDPPTQNAASGSAVWAWSADPTNPSATCWGQTDNATWNGAGNIPGADGLIIHTMTDNRPPFYALCFIERIA